MTRKEKHANRKSWISMTKRLYNDRKFQRIQTGTTKIINHREKNLSKGSKRRVIPIISKGRRTATEVKGPMWNSCDLLLIADGNQVWLRFVTTTLFLRRVWKKSKRRFGFQQGLLSMRLLSESVSILQRTQTMSTEWQDLQSKTKLLLNRIMSKGSRDEIKVLQWKRDHHQTPGDNQAQLRLKTWLSTKSSRRESKRRFKLWHKR